MTTDILVPALGESVSEATVAQWLKKVGDAVKADEPLVELETDKVTLEVNATEAGVLSEVLAGQGENVEVGALLGRIAPGNGTVTAAAPAAAPAATPAIEPAQPPASAVEGDGEPVDLVVPVLGESVNEATVGQWHKQVGDAVKADESLVELETDKVTLEVNAPAAGVLSEIRAEAGDTVAVGALLGVVMAGAAAAAPAAAAPQLVPAAAPAPAGPAHGALSPAVRKMIADAGLDPARVPGTGRDGRITKEDVQTFLAGSGAETPAAPAPAAPAATAGLDPGKVARSGPGDRITKADLLSFLGAGEAARPAAPSGPAAPTPAGPGRREERVRMTKLRQTIARRLKEAQDTAAMLTTFNEADMGAVMALRAQHKEAFEQKHGVKLGFMSFFTKAVVAALKELPAVNARIEGDELVYLHDYNIGMAVSTPAGLMVPVVRDCEHKSFAEIERTLAELAGKGRDGKLTMDELTGGTFTITNQERPVAIDGEVRVRPMMYLALSYDHRIIDGREAVTFLVRVKAFIEDPERLLLDL
jgi:2-oxoglutarate dehydrogenase E2 component (dihydrolipoamide succinyltransferase)